MKARAWLPPEAISSDRLEPIIKDLIGKWSDHWFAAVSASATAAFQDDWPHGGSEAVWRSCLPVVSIACAPNAKNLIAGAMLDVNVPPATIQAGDRELIEHLATEAIDDLLKRVGELALEIRPETGVSDSCIDLNDCHWWEISLAPRRAVLKLAIAAPAIVSIIKSKLVAPMAPKLGKLGDGLGEQRVGLAANVGRCSISLAELQDLSTGDVLILDRSASEPVELTVNGAESPLKASLETSGGQAVLVFAGSRKKQNG